MRSAIHGNPGIDSFACAALGEHNRELLRELGVDDKAYGEIPCLWHCREGSPAVQAVEE